MPIRLKIVELFRLIPRIPWASRWQNLTCSSLDRQAQVRLRWCVPSQKMRSRNWRNTPCMIRLAWPSLLSTISMDLVASSKPLSFPCGTRPCERLRLRTPWTRIWSALISSYVYGTRKRFGSTVWSSATTARKVNRSRRLPGCTRSWWVTLRMWPRLASMQRYPLLSFQPSSTSLTSWKVTSLLYPDASRPQICVSGLLKCTEGQKTPALRHQRWITSE